ncbi:sortase [Candidatus Microgenomates bacterium]|nr:sortase [Candidatus Microgenomates bacterium]
MKKKKIIRFFAFVFGLSGLVLLVSSFWPIIQYQLNESKNYETLLTPLVLESTKGQPQILDYTKASNWFPEAQEDVNFSESKVSFYSLSIPKLKIDNSTVAIGGEDLSKSLVQYPGTALPGKLGNSVIFGHSILPIFFDPENYMSIFSTLPTLKTQDDIDISFDGVVYKYKVEEIFEIYPTDIQILQQDKSDSFLTLVTCVPPGDPRKPKRLIIRARIVPPDLAYNAN